MAAGNNIFLDLTGPNGPVVGSCTDFQFKGKIELKSFSFSVAPVPRKRAQSPSSTAKKVVPLTDAKDGEDQAATEKRQDDSLTLTKAIDASSADLLLQYCKHLRPESKSQEFKQAILTYRLSRGAATFPLLVMTFTGLTLIDYQLEEITDETTLPTEKVSFAYKTCTIQYSAIPTSPTAAASPRSVTWDRTARQTR
jgi:type VI protein secretion system component Hcp